MTHAKKKLDEALRLLDELDATPLSQLNKKLDCITNAVVAAKYALFTQEPEEISA